MAISSGSSPASIHRRNTRMFVSSRPRRRSAFIGIARSVVRASVLVSPESLKVDRRGAARHRGELPPRDKGAPTAERYQLSDLVSVAGDRKGLSVLDGIHDFLRAVTKIALGDLRLCWHRSN